ncbi:MAG: 5-dehydro-2-deoxygluconokinase [Treponema sp.]|nr:5-dehydro-2-deoxygluconokinase [Treponema sp.]
MNYIEFDKNREFDVIALGRAAVDFNPADYYKTLVESEQFIKYLGGSPANIVVGLSRLGKKCGFLGCVSDDRFGDFVIDFFNKEHVDTTHMARAKHGEKIGLTFTEILSETESSILMYRDAVADLQLDVADITEAYIAKAKALLISGTALAASPSREAALKALCLAKKTGTPVIFDIDYRPYTWKSLDEVAVYYATVGSEASLILGSREEYDLMERLIQPNMNDEESASLWHGRCAKIIIIKHGKEGSDAYAADGKKFTVKPFPIKKLKSFGGGDGYASAFLYGLLEGFDIGECLELGSASASLLVAAHGCSAYMPTVAQIREYIAQCKRDYGEMVVRG